jgi:hypothetical protein
MSQTKDRTLQERLDLLQALLHAAYDHVPQSVLRERIAAAIGVAK